MPRHFPNWDSWEPSAQCALMSFLPLSHLLYNASTLESTQQPLQRTSHTQTQGVRPQRSPQETQDSSQQARFGQHGSQRTRWRDYRGQTWGRKIRQTRQENWQVRALLFFFVLSFLFIYSFFCLFFFAITNYIVIFLERPPLPKTTRSRLSKTITAHSQGKFPLTIILINNHI